MQIFTNANYNFTKWRWHALALSLVVILAGAVALAVKGIPLGIDFSGGTIVTVQLAEGGEQEVRAAVSKLPGEVTVQRYDDPAKRQIMIRLPQLQTVEAGANLESGSSAIEAALKASGLKYEVISRDVVGPSIGADLQRRGLYATLASILAITVYIGFRFRFSFAIGAIAATLHDVFVTIAFLVFFGYDFSLNIVAAILTITGYSVNDTIVIFDRVRENLRSNRREPLEQVVNTSVNQTLGRTIITAGTTFLSVLSLYLFGGEVLRGFAFTMLVGIVSGTYSTIFIASAIAIILSQRKTPVAVASASVGGAQVGAGPRRKSKRARA
jgi:preprotein translocase subunit SecF